MALSGTLNSSGYQGRYIQLTWTAKSSIPNNNSVISWSLKGAGQASSSWYSAGNFKVIINGTTVYSSSTRIDLYNGTHIADGTITIAHNSNGTKSFTASIEAGIYLYAVNCTGSATFTLDPIPRKATISSAPNFTDEQNPTIIYSNLAGNAVEALDACISLTGATDNIKYRSISKTGTSYTFNLTDAERNVLRAATSTSNTVTAHFYVRTKIAGEYHYSYLIKTLTIVNANPVISPTITDTNSSTISLTGDSSKLVRYYSNAKITMGVSALKSATISSKSVTNSGKTLTADGTIGAVNSGSFVFVATDSRGNSATKTVNQTMVDYVHLSCIISNDKPTVDGKFTFKVTGNYFNGSFGLVNNTLTVYYRYKINGGTYVNDWSNMSITKSGNTYIATANLTGLDYQTTYVFEAYAVDKLDTVYSAAKNIKASPVFDWGPNDFNVNGTLCFNNAGTVLRHDPDNDAVVISAPGSGELSDIYFRPNGTEDTSGEVRLYSNGTVNTSGDIVSNGVVVTAIARRNSALSSGTISISTSASRRFRVASNILLFGRPANGIADSTSVYSITAYNEYRPPIITTLSNSSSLTISSGGDQTNGYYITISNSSASTAIVSYVGTCVPTFLN